MSGLDGLSSVDSINPSISNKVAAKTNYAFALSKLLSDYDESSYEEGPNALFQQDYFYGGLYNKYAKPEFKKDKRIMDLTNEKVKNPINSNEKIGAFEF
jgi:hypothetical protein